MQAQPKLFGRADDDSGSDYSDNDSDSDEEILGRAAMKSQQARTGPAKKNGAATHAVDIGSVLKQMELTADASADDGEMIAHVTTSAPRRPSSPGCQCG